jgi:hypothetical protein
MSVRHADGQVVKELLELAALFVIVHDLADLAQALQQPLARQLLVLVGVFLRQLIRAGEQGLQQLVVGVLPLGVVQEAPGGQALAVEGDDALAVRGDGGQQDFGGGV